MTHTSASEIDQSSAGTSAVPPASRPGARFLSSVVGYGRRFSLSGLIVALLFFCMSLTPSLSPRVWFYQAAVTGLSMICGYALGVLIAWIIRKIGFKPRLSARANKIAWCTLGVLALILIPLFILLGAMWQDQIRDLFGAEPGGKWRGTTQTVIALGLALGILQISRGLRWVTRWTSRQFGKVVPVPVARLVAVVVVAVLAVLVVNGTVVTFVMNTLNNVYAQLDTTTDEGIEQSTLSERSGSPESLSSWESLGAQGRKFTATGPSLAELAAFVEAGNAPGVESAIEPIRAYAGMASGETLHDVAALVVAELDRTDAWSRKVLVVATSTGTGWIDPSMAQTIEFMHGGDTAIASMQYSYLPSWVAFVGDRDTPPAASKALFEAVYAAWQTKPADSRPQLVVFGASLGSFGSQGAFSGLQDLSERTQGALWVGTPNFTELWSRFTDSRDPGSFQYAPVLDEGARIRWGAASGTAADLLTPPATWEDPKVVYLQHASDGVVWWSFDLILQEPDWFKEPTGPGVLDNVFWIPGVTFWQITMDLFVAANAPSGFGHNYQLEYSEAWASIAPPEGWSDADTARLRETIAKQPNEA